MLAAPSIYCGPLSDVAGPWVVMFGPIMFDLWITFWIHPWRIRWFVIQESKFDLLDQKSLRCREPKTQNLHLKYETKAASMLAKRSWAKSNVIIFNYVRSPYNEYVNLKCPKTWHRKPFHDVKRLLSQWLELSQLSVEMVPLPSVYSTDTYRMIADNRTITI